MIYYITVWTEKLREITVLPFLGKGNVKDVISIWVSYKTFKIIVKTFLSLIFSYVIGCNEIV